jgi:hypothetical protein
MIIIYEGENLFFFPFLLKTLRSLRLCGSFFISGGKPCMTETTDEKPFRAQTADILLTADNGGQIDTVGAIVLGVAFLILLFAYMRAQGRNRKLIERLARLENQKS